MDKRWAEIERIYHAARELDKSAPPAYLAKACAGDESLRREVESLLAQADQAGSFLESPAIEVAAEALAKDQPGGRLSEQSAAALEPGGMVWHYGLTGKSGWGGMEEVYPPRSLHSQ
jgi:eukaryotic-like serine/threonine-protein kinase